MAISAYNILLVEESEAKAAQVQDILARMPGFRITSHVRDALAAVAYFRGRGEFADRQRFPLPDIVLLDLNAPHCADIEFLQWAQRRVFRPVLAIFSSPEGSMDSGLAEQLQADLYEPNIWDADVFKRFLHFAGKIADIKRRER